MKKPLRVPERDFACIRKGLFYIGHTTYSPVVLRAGFGSKFQFMATPCAAEEQSPLPRDILFTIGEYGRLGSQIYSAMYTGFPS